MKIKYMASRHPKRESVVFMHPKTSAVCSFQKIGEVKEVSTELAAYIVTQYPDMVCVVRDGDPGDEMPCDDESSKMVEAYENKIATPARRGRPRKSEA